ncbi:hypothetical protein Hanom_Chr04g00368451 [Helianthus anomalus]
MPRLSPTKSFNISCISYRYLTVKSQKNHKLLIVSIANLQMKPKWSNLRDQNDPSSFKDPSSRLSTSSF